MRGSALLCELTAGRLRARHRRSSGAMSVTPTPPPGAVLRQFGFDIDDLRRSLDRNLGSCVFEMWPRMVELSVSEKSETVRKRDPTFGRTCGGQVGK